MATIADMHRLTFDVAERFSQPDFDDGDLHVLAYMKPGLYYSVLGITHANAVGFSQACALELGLFLDQIIDGEEEASQ